MIKNIAPFFSHDNNARHDPKLVRLRIKHDWYGYGLYFAIVEILRGTKDYSYECAYDEIAYELKTESSIVKSIIEDFELFEINNNMFKSMSLINRMEIKDQKSVNAKKAADTRWKNERGKNNNSN